MATSYVIDSNVFGLSKGNENIPPGTNVADEL